MVALACSILTMKNPTWITQWQDVMNQLQDQLPSQKFDAWIRPLEAKLVDDAISISCASNFFINGLKADCGSIFEACIHTVFGSDIDINYEIGVLQTKQVAEKSTAATPSNMDGKIDPRLTFKTFIVGTSNKFVFAAY